MSHPAHPAVRCPRSLAAPLTLAALLALPLPATAAEVRGTFSTLFAARADALAGDEVLGLPLYELLALEVAGLRLPGTDGARLVMQGWGRLQIADDALAPSSADLGLFYLEAERGPLELRLGRQHLVYGVSRMSLVDGLDARARIGRYGSARAFFGFTAHPELRHATGNWQAGGRLALNLLTFGQTGEVGLAYLLRRQAGETHRHELGADAAVWLGASRWLAVAVLSPERRQLVEARLNGSARLSPAWLVAVDAERVSPAALLPLSSIFSVFADAPHDAIGAEASFTPTPHYAVDLAGHALLLDQGFLGYRATLRAVTYREAARRSAVGAELRRLDEGERGYLRGRLFTALQLRPSLRISADAFAYRFDTEVNAQRQSLLLQGSAIVDLIDELRLAATLAGGTTPWASTQLEGMVRLMYGWNVDLAREVGP